MEEGTDLSTNFISADRESALSREVPPGISFRVSLIFVSAVWQKNGAAKRRSLRRFCDNALYALVIYEVSPVKCR